MAGVVPLHPDAREPAGNVDTTHSRRGVALRRRPDRLRTFQRKPVIRCASPGPIGARCAPLLGWANSRRGTGHPGRHTARRIARHRRTAARRIAGSRIASHRRTAGCCPAVTPYRQTGSTQNRRQCQSQESARHRVAGRWIVQALTGRTARVGRTARNAGSCAACGYPAGRQAVGTAGARFGGLGAAAQRYPRHRLVHEAVAEESGRRSARCISSVPRWTDPTISRRAAAAL
jgi:hypothetical protein